VHRSFSTTFALRDRDAWTKAQEQILRTASPGCFDRAISNGALTIDFHAFSANLDKSVF